MTDSICSIPDCDRIVDTKGWCRRHYMRWYRKGDPLDGRDLVHYFDPHEAFKNRTRRDGDCIIWTASTNRSGYGQMWFQSKGWKAHRVAWYLQNGPIPPKAEIDHTCHRRGCVNVEHLRLVTRKQNMENLTGAHPRSKSGIRGVHYRDGKWRVVVVHNRKRHDGGNFTDIAEAEAAAIALRNELFTHNDLDRAA